MGVGSEEGRVNGGAAARITQEPFGKSRRNSRVCQRAERWLAKDLRFPAKSDRKAPYPAQDGHNKLLKK
jgi:hypothetical protein